MKIKKKDNPVSHECKHEADFPELKVNVALVTESAKDIKESVKKIEQAILGPDGLQTNVALQKQSLFKVWKVIWFLLFLIVSMSLRAFVWALKSQ